MINYDYRNIQKLYAGPDCEKPDVMNYGLVIIDEAHVFLNPDTERYKALTSTFIQTEKVVFLTATPIKSGEADLETYVEIGKKLRAGKPCKNEITAEDLKRMLVPQDSDALPICSSFEIESPVTRYFKETFEDLRPKRVEQTKRKAKRNAPHIWSYSVPRDKDESPDLEESLKTLNSVDKRYNRSHA